ncbi:cytochrome P450 [Mycolicibacterium pulveris]|uniref:Cytochrome P450 n=1 Tax=Mycolicibacterium pulveris TaxID=36813 RepID=A0A7I7URT0_MYCPV|nr:cytochrome P450 [Mycolicibacterium pulveris]MCV6982170.1 cytochrome P450 [Mycolicibacterium pulveris]BBY84184.1 cytochrome P450 [Mycolicibacterium pulveris]
MVETVERTDLHTLPLAPKNPLPYRQQLKAVRSFHSGLETLRDAGGPVTRLTLAPKWLAPTVVIATSPQGARDILGRGGGHIEKTRVHAEMRHLLGPNLFDLTHEPWLPRRRALQPMFTKQHVREFAGHMAEAAQTVADTWTDGAEVDLDTECRKLTLRALGRSVLGIDLDAHAEVIAEPLHVTTEYITDRAMRPINAPRWLPTPARRRARTASATLHRLADDILQECRADPTREAPLVHALIAASDPATGQTLSDNEIRDELIAFMLAGHDTTATTLAYAMWALGHHIDMQDKVRAEALAVGDHELTPDDVPALRYTVQVLHEALRLCPPGAATARMAMQDVEVDGYRVEAGTMLVVGIYALHRDPALWDHPLDFDPDRFSPRNSEGRDRWQYLPFGAGPRSCIGDHFAMLEATLALATVVRCTEIRSKNPDFPIITPFTTVAAEPIRATVTARGGRRR